MRMIISVHIQQKILRKSHVSKIFFAKKWFLLIFTYTIFIASKFLRARWLYDVTVNSYEIQWYLFWYQWIEEVHTYTLVANIGVSGVPYRKSREGGCNNLPPPFGERVTKNTSGGRGLSFLLISSLCQNHSPGHRPVTFTQYTGIVSACKALIIETFRFSRLNERNVSLVASKWQFAPTRWCASSTRGRRCYFYYVVR